MGHDEIDDGLSLDGIEFVIRIEGPEPKMPEFVEGNPSLVTVGLCQSIHPALCPHIGKGDLMEMERLRTESPGDIEAHKVAIARRVCARLMVNLSDPDKWAQVLASVEGRPKEVDLSPDRRPPEPVAVGAKCLNRSCPSVGQSYVGLVCPTCGIPPTPAIERSRPTSMRYGGDEGRPPAVTSSFYLLKREFPDSVVRGWSEEVGARTGWGRTTFFSRMGALVRHGLARKESSRYVLRRLQGRDRIDVRGGERDIADWVRCRSARAFVMESKESFKRCVRRALAEKSRVWAINSVMERVRLSARGFDAVNLRKLAISIGASARTASRWKRRVEARGLLAQVRRWSTDFAPWFGDGSSHVRGKFFARPNAYRFA